MTLLKCGLLGERLGHSYSPAIHKRLGDYEYRLYEKSRDDLEDFVKNGAWDSLNVTIPYKKAVMQYMDLLGEAAAGCGSVNTIVRQKDGRLLGDCTDVYGFMDMVRHSGMEVKGSRALVLGSGGASAAVCTALDMLGCSHTVISRSGENNYDNLFLHKDAEIIVNTTPVGMYPGNGASPVDLTVFPACRGVLDIIYNPARTALLLQAEALGIQGENGLYMLVAQARKSAELFTGTEIPDSRAEEIYSELSREMQNIVLIGMPGCGKSTLAEKIGRRTGRPVYDSDNEIRQKTGMTPEQIINRQGEDSFRQVESLVLSELGRLSGAVIAVGGGAVTREQNYNALHQNGVILWLKRNIWSLSADGRPLSQKKGIEALYRERKALYERFADCSVELGSRTAEAALELIKETVK